jgi:hypothetical protein
MPCEFGDIVLVRFPFTNQTALKQRLAPWDQIIHQ